VLIQKYKKIDLLILDEWLLTGDRIVHDSYMLLVDGDNLAISNNIYYIFLREKESHLQFVPVLI
jgi:hypothetical protein